jgi:DNA-binding response OmpR family regulator
MTAQPDRSAFRPALVVSHTDTAFAQQTGQSFRALGYDVHLALTGLEARRLACRLPSVTVVLGTELPDESGWLVCDKLTRESPHARVILHGAPVDARRRRLAAFVRAACLVHPSGGVPALVREVCGESLPAVG